MRRPAKASRGSQARLSEGNDRAGAVVKAYEGIHVAGCEFRVDVHRGAVARKLYQRGRRPYPREIRRQLDDGLVQYRDHDVFRTVAVTVDAQGMSQLMQKG